MRIDGSPGAGGVIAAFAQGAAASPATTYSNGTALTAFYAIPTAPATPGVVNYAKTDNMPIAPGSGFPTTPINAAAFATIAVVFNNLADANGAANATTSQSYVYVDGTVVSRAAAGTILATVDYLWLGRTVSSAAAGPLTFDTVQIYDEAPTAAQIAAVPEPTTLAGLAVVSFGLLRRRRAV